MENNAQYTGVSVGLQRHLEKMKTDKAYRDEIISRYKSNRPNAVEVAMLNKETKETIKVFPKLMEAALWIRENTGYKKADYSTINKVCKGRGKTAYGYGWRYNQPE